MTVRDRLVLLAVIGLAVVGFAWLTFVSPERKKAHTAATALAAAEAQLASAHSELATARSAQARYAASYSTIVSLGKAVPTSEEVPSLMYEVAQASKQKSVEFASITSEGGSKGVASTTAASAAAAAAAGGGFQQVPFTFVFNGSYSGLEQMLRRLTNFATKTPAGALKVNGRLLTIQGVTLGPLTLQGKAGSTPHLTATVTATAYALPPEATTGSTTSGATPAGSGSSPSSPSSSTGSTTSAPPAVIGAKP
jgi:hypothetical protein